MADDDLDTQALPTGIDRYAKTVMPDEYRTYRVLFNYGAILDVYTSRRCDSNMRDFALTEATRLWGKGEWKIEGATELKG